MKQKYMASLNRIVRVLRSKAELQNLKDNRRAAEVDPLIAIAGGGGSLCITRWETPGPRAISLVSNRIRARSLLGTMNHYECPLRLKSGTDSPRRSSVECSPGTDTLHQAL